jgi:restriction system protein
MVSDHIDNAKQELESALQEDLLQRVRKMSPSDFEDLILRLLLAMGYGQADLIPENWIVFG